MGAGSSTGTPYVPPPTTSSAIETNYKNKNGKVTKLYRMNASKTYVAPKTTPAAVNESEWNLNKSNTNRNVYRHKTVNSKIRTNYKRANGTKQTLYGFNKNKAYVDPTLQELMKINKNAVRELIDNFKDKFEGNPDIEPVIEKMEQVIQPLMNKDAPTEAEIEDVQQRIKEIIHDETVVKQQKNQVTVPLATVGQSIITILELLGTGTIQLGLALLDAIGGTRRKRQTRHRRTRRHG
ncbi:MAG: hypothetical protein EB127_24080 [Alphaproteobacteria bacterium]|nr:hypothetical protein [Alphaproteobacteria bacterium]